MSARLRGAGDFLSISKAETNPMLRDLFFTSATIYVRLGNYRLILQTIKKVLASPGGNEVSSYAPYPFHEPPI